MRFCDMLSSDSLMLAESGLLLVMEGSPFLRTSMFNFRKFLLDVEVLCGTSFLTTGLDGLFWKFMPSDMAAMALADRIFW